MNLGDRYNQLTVIGPFDIDGPANRRKWLFRCDCGGTIKSRRDCVKSGGTKRCAGCAAKAIGQTKSMSSPQISKHPLYFVWAGMRQRCEDVNHKQYMDYGGRGIKVCKHWSKFKNFLADVGERPFLRASLDRINNDGDYEPGNVRWATDIEQANNRRKPK